MLQNDKENLLKLKEDLRKVYNEFTESTRIDAIRSTIDSDIYETILDLIISTINEYQSNPTENVGIINSRVREIKRLIGVYNDYSKQR